MRRPSRRVVLTGASVAAALALVLAAIPLASADPKGRTWTPSWPADAFGSTEPTKPPADEKPPADHAGPGHGTPNPGDGSGGGGLQYDPAKIPQREAQVVFTGPAISQTSESPEGGDGDFRTVCEYSHMAPDDPIVKFGKPGESHLHTFFGNTLANANSKYSSLLASGDSTCRGGTANRSAYWVPSIIDTSTNTPQKPAFMHVYYKRGYHSVSADKIVELPPGLKMVAGDAKASSGQNRAGWHCWDGGGNPFSSETIPQCGKPSMDIEFPQCWNGKDLDSDDHKSHMAYAINGQGCPESHPKAIPVITYHVVFEARGDVSKWRLSSDMYDSSKPGGFSVHGDWFGGWDPKIVQAWTQNCVKKDVSCKSHLLGDGRAMGSKDNA